VDFDVLAVDAEQIALGTGLYRDVSRPAVAEAILVVEALFNKGAVFLTL
jgi:hypothetical protein